MPQSNDALDERAMGEVGFGLDEVFYSRTDSRGVILAGNGVFKRISGYTWNDLIGAPHRIVRSRMTPRAVFRILWTTIATNEPAVAYVCNRAADGRTYWVLATVLPFSGGYLSIRIKPTAPLFEVIKTVYSRLSAAESAGDLTIEASVAALGAALQDLGHANYPTFMRAALSQEYTARAQARGRPGLMQGETVRRIRQGLSETIIGQADLQRDLERLKVLPTNLSIMASRHEPSGGPLVAVANIYLTSTARILAQIEAFSSGETSLSVQMADLFERAVFLITCSELQHETASLVAGEDWSKAGLSPETEVGYLDDLGASYRQAARSAIDKACALAEKIAEAGFDLRRAMLALETVTVMGKVESARIGTGGERIQASILQLQEVNAEILTAIENIVRLSGTINSGMRRIKADFAS